MRKKRVVVTGLGVVAPNALGVEAFHQALLEGKSGIKHWKESERLNFRCQIGGTPPLTSDYVEKLLPLFFHEKITNKGIIYGCLAGIEAWNNAGLKSKRTERLKDVGIIFGAGALGLDSYIDEILLTVNRGENRRLGTTVIPQCMNSGASAYLNQLLGLGHKSQSNSSACITGSESILLGYDEIASGKARIMVCGSTEGDGKFIWGAFDGMRVLCLDSNENPKFGSRPMSDSSSGFVPSGGSGALILEDLESALERGATIHAEILGGAQNTGGMRNGGTMTAPNTEAMVDCIKLALNDSGIFPNEIDLISGHLTSTKADPIEIESWTRALRISKDEFPLINTPKSMIGHCIAGAGSIESIASILQIQHGFVHKNINITDETIHPKIQDLVNSDKVPRHLIKRDVNTVVKSNFGFGDLNCVLIFRKFQE